MANADVSASESTIEKKEAPPTNAGDGEHRFLVSLSYFHGFVSLSISWALLTL